MAARTTPVIQKAIPTLESLLNLYLTPNYGDQPPASVVSERIREIVTHHPFSPIAQVLTALLRNDQANQMSRIAIQNPLIAAGQSLPNVELFTTFPPGHPNAMKVLTLKVQDLFIEGGLLVAVPGAFTPTCHNSHVNTILSNIKVLAAFKKIVFVSLDSPDAVGNGWRESFKQKFSPFPTNVEFVSAGTTDFGDLLGILRHSNSERALGLNLHRCALIIGPKAVVEEVLIETDSGKTDNTCDTAILKSLEQQAKRIKTSQTN